MANWLDKYEQGGMVLKKKTKDNYGKRENANEGYSTAGPGWIGEGTTNKGFNYNGAWGGTMAMGGALPGAVGFTYARTINPAPANGKYTKKTKASAQNGQEMKFYQEGLDFKPKSISQNGSVIKDEYPMMQFGGPIKPDGVPIFRENSDFLNPYDDYDFYKPPLYPTPLYDKMINNYSDKQQVFGDKMSKNDSHSYSESSNTINLSSGRFRGAKVDPEMINDIVKAAKDNNVDPWLMLSLVGRESTFGSGTYDNRNRTKLVTVGNKEYLVSGWNVAEDYTPYKLSRFLADNQVPGVEVALKNKFGWQYAVTDKKAINDYLEKNPQLIDRYNKKLQSTPDIGELDSFALAAQRIKKKGIQNYNPGDPKYPSMINEDMNLLKNDAALKAYMKSKEYRDGGVIKDDRGQLAYPGEITEIGSNDITMQGVDYPVLGVSDTGDTQMMYPDQDYKFDGEKVTEYPMAQDGGWLDKYQDGGNINKKLKEEAEERLARMNTPKATISQYTPKPGEQAKFDKQKLERIAEDNAPLNRMAASKGARNMQDAIEAALIMEGGMFAGKLIGKGAKAAGKYLTEETALKNAYKLNPLAFKANPEAYYRMVGEAGYADALKSGVVRPPIGSGHTEAYYNKGYPLDTRLRDVTGRAGYEGPYMAEVKGNKELFVDENVAGYTGPMFDDPVVYSKEPISISNPSVKLYKENWLKGYKEVAKPTSTQQITRGPINWWDEPKYKKQNPNFDPQTYLNNPVGNQFYSRDIPKGMEPRYFEEKKNGGWLNKYK